MLRRLGRSPSPSAPKENRAERRLEAGPVAAGDDGVAAQARVVFGVIEVKTEVRFRAAEDGKVVSETSNDVKIKTGK